MSAPRVFRVGIAWSTDRWSTGLHAYASDHVADVEVMLIRDDRAAVETGLDVLIVDDLTTWLTRSFIVLAERAGVTLVGVWHRNDPAGEQRLADLGITHRLDAAMPPADVMFLVSRLRPDSRHAERSTLDDLTAGLQAHNAGPKGSAIAVGGPSGAGAREVAIGLAASLAGQAATLLIDANETSPGVARRLGLDLSPHIVTAIDSLGTVLPDGVGQAVAGCLADLGPGTSTLPFDTIVGLPSGRDWDRLAAHELDRLIEICERYWSRVVVATSPIIDDLRRWVDRYAVSRHVLATADVVVGVCEATPRGLLRFGEWLAELTTFRSGRIPVVINRVPAGRFYGPETQAQLVSLCGDLIGPVFVAPIDRHVTSAEWDATLPRRGPFTKAIAPVARHLDDACTRIHSEVAVG